MIQESNVKYDVFITKNIKKEFYKYSDVLKLIVTDTNTNIIKNKIFYSYNKDVLVSSVDVITGNLQIFSDEDGIDSDVYHENIFRMLK